MGVGAGAISTAARVFLDPVLAVVFQATCGGCAEPLARPLRAPLCEDCWQALPRHNGPLCGCGFPLPSGFVGGCGRCRRGLSPFERGLSLGPYAGTLRLLVHELKYRGKRRVAERLADLLAAEAERADFLPEGVVLVPVPLHPKRLRERGFNQSELLASALGRRTGRPVVRQALIRRVDTPAQTGLAAVARRRNVQHAFALGQRSRVKGRVVVLVDDVLTTGATARACASLLRDGGASQVRILTIARAA